MEREGRGGEGREEEGRGGEGRGGEDRQTTLRFKGKNLLQKADMVHRK